MQGRLISCVGSFSEARPVLGEVTETLCVVETENLGWTGYGCFPRASHTSGESSLAEVGVFPGRAIPRSRVPFRSDEHSPDGGMNVCIG